MPNIEQSIMIEAIPEDVWDALTNPDRISLWSGASADFRPEPEYNYSLWDGSIQGRVVEAEPNKRLVQTWKPDNWEVDNSVVTFILTPTENGTQVELVHENVQDWDFDDTTEGWDTLYLGAIKRMIEGRSENRQPTSKKLAAAKKGAPKKAAAKKTAPKKTATSRQATAKRPTTAAKRSTAKKSAAKKSTAKKGASKRTVRR